MLKLRCLGASKPSFKLFGGDLSVASVSVMPPRDVLLRQREEIVEENSIINNAKNQVLKCPFLGWALETI